MLGERCAEERDKRWWAAEVRTEKDERPPPYLQLERVYKSLVKDLKARLAVSEAKRAEAEARAELNHCLWAKAELELEQAP